MDVKLQVPIIQVDEAPDENLDPDTFDYETDYLAKILNGHDEGNKENNRENYEDNEEVAEDYQNCQLPAPVLDSGVVILGVDERVVTLDQEKIDVTHNQDARVAALDQDEKDLDINQDARVAALGLESGVVSLVDEEEEMQVDICYGMNMYGPISPACVWNVVVVVGEMINIAHAASC